MAACTVNSGPMAISVTSPGCARIAFSISATPSACFFAGACFAYAACVNTLSFFVAGPAPTGMSLRPAAARKRSSSRARSSVSPKVVVMPSTFSSELFSINPSANASSMSSPISVSSSTSSGLAAGAEPFACACAAGTAATKLNPHSNATTHGIFMHPTLPLLPSSATL